MLLLHSIEVLIIVLITRNKPEGVKRVLMKSAFVIERDCCLVNFSKTRGFLYVQTGLTFKNSTWCSPCAECFFTDFKTDDFCFTHH
jgi:hypothetical protein